jgi:hypothetical protein
MPSPDKVQIGQVDEMVHKKISSMVLHLRINEAIF